MIEAIDLQIKQIINDSMEQPPHRSTLLSRPQDEDNKYMQWGVNSPTEHDYSQRSHSKQLNDSGHRFVDGKKSYAGQESKPYFADYSQMNAMETGFKKMKSTQIQMLKELKKQYDVLRNSSLDSRVLPSKKLTSQSESNLQENSASNSQYQSSLKSKTNRSASRQKHDGKELRMVSLEKKQLEVMLNNSMRKIEELLHSQIELKRTVLDLRGKLDSGRNAESDFQVAVRRYKDNEESLSRQLQDQKRENETLRARMKELSISTANLQGAVNIKELQLRKKDEKVRLCEEEIQLERTRYKSLELDVKKLRMEYELLQKSKGEEIVQLNRSKDSAGETWRVENGLKVKRLEEELAVKDERYALLLAKMSNGEAEQQKQQEREYSQNLQKLIATLQEEKNQQNSEAIASVLTKLNQMHRPDEHLLEELSALKRELQVVKTTQNTPRDNPTSHLQQKIREMEKTMEEQNVEKMYFMEDLQKLTRDFNELKRDREDVMRQNKELKYILDRLQAENSKYRSDLDAVRKIPVDLTESQVHNQQLMAKLQRFNFNQIELTAAREELSKQQQQSRAKTHAYEEQIRLLKRHLNQEEFKVFKGHEEHQLKLSLLKIQHQTEISRLQQDLDRVHKNYALEKSDIESRKIQLESKLLDKDKEIEEKSVAAQAKDKQAIIQQVHSEYSQRMKEQEDRHARQIKGLLSQLQTLAHSSEGHVQLAWQNGQLEQEIVHLKKAVRGSRKLTESVDHLWQVKETQYSNINQIIASLQM